MKKTKSQVSMEYLMIVGFVFVITIPLLFLYFNYSSDADYRITSNQLSQIAKQIGDAAESVYYLGEPSQTTLKLYVPDNIASAQVNGREIVFSIKTKSGMSDIVEVTAVNMTGTLPITQGIHFITVKAAGNQVNITTN